MNLIEQLRGANGLPLHNLPDDLAYQFGMLKPPSTCRPVEPTGETFATVGGGYKVRRAERIRRQDAMVEYLRANGWRGTREMSVAFGVTVQVIENDLRILHAQRRVARRGPRHLYQWRDVQ